MNRPCKTRLNPHPSAQSNDLFEEFRISNAICMLYVALFLQVTHCLSSFLLPLLGMALLLGSLCLLFVYRKKICPILGRGNSQT